MALPGYLFGTMAKHVHKNTGILESMKLYSYLCRRSFMITSENMTKTNASESSCSFSASFRLLYVLHLFFHGPRVKPIQMAYSSYENTRSSTQESDKLVIIMHGLMGSKSNWNSLSKVLHNKTLWKVISVDARNHGDSPHTPEHSYPHLVEDIRYLMEHLGVKKASLIGHSMGGRAVMMMALKYPEMVEKLLVLDISPIGTSPQLMNLMKVFDAMQSVRLKPNTPLSQARKVVDQQLSVTINEKGMRDFLIMNLVETEGGLFRWRMNLEALRQNFVTHIASFPKLEGSFMGPTLFLGGEKSDYLKREDHSEILKIFPSAKFEYIAGAGHLLHVEKPSDFLSISIKFLQDGS